MLITDPIDTVLSLRKRFGDVFRFDAGFLPTVIIANHDLAVELFNSDALLGRSWVMMPHFARMFNTKSGGMLRNVAHLHNSREPKMHIQGQFMESH